MPNSIFVLLQSDMITFETKVNDLEGNISKKEKELTHLSSQNQSLSLQKSVIETRSNEIENEKVPLFSQIEEMSKDTKALSHELKEKDKFAIAKELEISRNTQKMKNQEKQMKLLEAQVRTLKREFVIIGGLENDVEMKNAIIAAYKKYG
jgi:chromosome segregation ATPase